MLIVCSPSVDAETTHHAGASSGRVRERCSPSYKLNESVPTKKTSTNERETINCCYGYTNTERYFVLCCFFSHLWFRAC